jgi:hypothetical protein
LTPVRTLQLEYKSLREELASSSAISIFGRLAKKKRLSELLKQIMAAKENAFNDIYERMNSCGSMGLSLSGQDTAVDLHGLSIEAAKRFIKDPILPILPVLKKITVITGRGLHSKDGKCVLKQAIKIHLQEINVKFEDVDGNEGAIVIFC